MAKQCGVCLKHKVDPEWICKYCGYGLCKKCGGRTSVSDFPWSNGIDCCNNVTCYHCTLNYYNEVGYDMNGCLVCNLNDAPGATLSFLENRKIKPRPIIRIKVKGRTILFKVYETKIKKVKDIMKKSKDLVGITGDKYYEKWKIEYNTFTTREGRSEVKSKYTVIIRGKYMTNLKRYYNLVFKVVGNKYYLLMPFENGDPLYVEWFLYEEPLEDKDSLLQPELCKTIEIVCNKCFKDYPKYIGYDNPNFLCNKCEKLE